MTAGPDTTADPREDAPGTGHGAVARLARALVLAGGAALGAAACLGTASAALRLIWGHPIPGDFELVSIGSGLGVFGMLAWGTLRRSNILVDSATTWLPARANAAIDAFWSLCWAAVLLVLAERMAQGALDTWRSGTTTMVLGWPTWWAVALGAAGLAATALAAIASAGELLRPGTGKDN